MSKRRIEIVDYDPRWESRYQSEAHDLRGVFADALVGVHHVGSTSVPGLQSKPTIDILVEVAEGFNIPSFDPSMEALGYICRGECLDATIPGTRGRFYYVLRDGPVHLNHAHACTVGHPEIAKILCFRDYLRSHAGAAERYGNLKAKLSDQFSFDNIRYMQGKDAHVKELIEVATKWASTSWVMLIERLILHEGEASCPLCPEDSSRSE